MMLPQPNKRQRLSTKPTTLPMLNASENEEVLEMTDTVASMDLSGETKRAMKVSSEAMKSVFDM